MATLCDAVGSSVELMVDCHSFFDVPLARSVAERLERYKLGWYEEPVAPERTGRHSGNPEVDPATDGWWRFCSAGGFAPLCRRHAVDVIMPDVKHCGGLLEMTRIAAMAKADEVSVAPPNPSGPVSTAATVQVYAGINNFRILELQWGEVSWRSDMVTPPEHLL
jgi:galactonate dehydratase